MEENFLEKKPMLEITPIFNHQHKDVEQAIGVKGMVENLRTKMERMLHDASVMSPSKAVEYFYKNFTKAELSFLAMHHLSREVERDLTSDEEYREKKI